MTIIVREFVAGVAAAMGFLVLAFGIAMPWWLGIVLAAGLYIGVRVLFPVAPSLHDIIYEGGITEAERLHLVAEGRRHYCHST